YIGGEFLEIQVVDDQGYILGTNDQTSQSIVGLKSTDRDVQQALLLESSRKYQYLDEDKNSRILKNVSPIFSPSNSGEIIGIVMMESNIETVYSQIRDVVTIFLNASFFAIIITIILAVIISRGITKPISEMRSQTMNIAQGDYSG